MSDPTDDPPHDPSSPPPKESAAEPGEGSGAVSVGGEVVSIEDARRRSEEKAAGAPTPPPAPTADAGTFLRPIMETLARELAGIAATSPDGKVELGGEGEASKARTQAVLRAVGAGLGAALADALGKFASGINIKMTRGTDEPPPAGPSAPSAPASTPGVPTAEPDKPEPKN